MVRDLPVIPRRLPNRSECDCPNQVPCPTSPRSPAADPWLCERSAPASNTHTTRHRPNDDWVAGTCPQITHQRLRRQRPVLHYRAFRELPQQNPQQISPQQVEKCCSGFSTDELRLA